MPENTPVVAEASEGKTFLETLTEDIHSKSNTVIDFGIITAIVTALGSIWEMCKNRGSNPAQRLKQKGPDVRSAVWQAINEEHDDLNKRQKRVLFRESMQKLRSLSDTELEQIEKDLEELVIKTYA